MRPATSTRPPPAVSVIIIFLDPGIPFFREAIESVRAQTFEDWELILVDDGSRDGSSEFARALAAAEPERIRYLEHEDHRNRGMSASRNLGIAAARGRYLAFLDADDVYLPERLAHHVRILEAHPTAAMVFGRHALWFSWQAGSAALDSVHELGFRPERIHRPPGVLLKLLATSGRLNPGICTQTVRREAALAVGGFEETFRGSHEDQVFMAKIFSRFPVFVTARVDSRYRQHANSCTSLSLAGAHVRRGVPNFARERYLRWLDRHLRRNGLMTLRLRLMMARKLLVYDHPWLHALTRGPRLPRALRGRRAECGPKMLDRRTALASSPLHLDDAGQSRSRAHES